MKALHIWHSEKVVSLDSRAACRKLGPALPEPPSRFSAPDLLSQRELGLERGFWKCGVFLIKFLRHESHVAPSSFIRPPFSFIVPIYSGSCLGFI